MGERTARGHDIDDDPAHERRYAAAERAAWAAWGVVIACGLAGALGDGALSGVERGSGSGWLRVEHERFARAGAPTRVRATLRGPDEPGGGVATLWVERGLLRRFEVRAATPEPVSWLSRDGWVGARFAVEGEGPVEAGLTLRPVSAGRAAGRLSAGSGPGEAGSEVEVRQLVWP